MTKKEKDKQQNDRQRAAAKIMANPSTKSDLSVLQYVFYQLVVSDEMLEFEMDAIERYIKVREEEMAAKNKS